MENYGIDMKGNIQIESVATKPTWAAADERRMIYVAAEDRIYYGSGTKWEHVVNNSYYVGEHNKGWLKRPKFKWINTTTIDIYPGAYHYAGNGTTVPEQYVYWNDKLTFILGNGGSNASSDALGSNQWHFIYLHAPSILTYGVNGELDEKCFINSTTATPTLLTTGGYGVYYGISRAIFAVKTDTSGNVLKFYQNGDYVQFDEPLTIANNTIMLGNVWYKHTCSLPLMTNVNLKTQLTFEGWRFNLTSAVRYRPDGSSATGIYLYSLDSSNRVYQNNTLDLYVGTNGKLELYNTQVDGTNYNYLYFLSQNGWYLLDGM